MAHNIRHHERLLLKGALAGPRLCRALLIGLLSLYLALVVSAAWMCDDAFITLRTVDNFVRGYGLVWNVGERVQTYTHPLWMFVLAALYAITLEPYYTTVIFSIVLSAITAALILWQSRSDALLMALCAAALIGSKAFVDYSTSGLENPLAHLLIAICVITWVKGRPQIMAVAAGLLMLNRLDHGLLILPALLTATLKLKGRDRLIALGAAFAPIIVWTLFSLIYYGFPFPNTYYAKQSPAISRSAYLAEGLAYLLDVLQHDPITPVMLIVAPLAVSTQRTSARKGLLVLAGIALHMAYLLWIGGDFMTGRLFSAPFAAAVTLLAAAGGPVGFKLKPGLLIASLGLSLLTQPSPNVLTGIDYGSDGKAHRHRGAFIIADERAAYYPMLGLLRRLHERDPLMRFQWVRLAQEARARDSWFYVFPTVGLFGYYAGPSVYVVDQFALGDAFLARLKADPQNWRVGHLWRRTPDGYLLSKALDKNMVRDAELSEFYDRINKITRAPLFDPDRLTAILQTNLGPLPRYQSAPHKRSDYFIGELDGTRQPFPIKPSGMDVVLGYPGIEAGITLIVSATANYTLEFFRGENLFYALEISAQRCEAADNERFICRAQAGALDEAGYDRIRITHDARAFTPFVHALALSREGSDP